MAPRRGPSCRHGPDETVPRGRRRQNPALTAEDPSLGRGALGSPPMGATSSGRRPARLVGSSGAVGTAVCGARHGTGRCAEVSVEGADAAEALKLTSSDIRALEVIDEIVKEPHGGAHRDHKATAKKLHEALTRNLRELRAVPPGQLVEERYQKFRKMSRFIELSG